jgi:hypothetical protein
MPVTLDSVFCPGIWYRLPLQVAFVVGAAIPERIYVVNHIIAARAGRGILAYELPHGRRRTSVSKSWRCNASYDGQRQNELLHNNFSLRWWTRDQPRIGPAHCVSGSFGGLHRSTAYSAIEFLIGDLWLQQSYRGGCAVVGRGRCSGTSPVWARALPVVRTTASRTGTFFICCPGDQTQG